MDEDMMAYFSRTPDAPLRQFLKRDDHSVSKQKEEKKPLHPQHVENILRTLVRKRKSSKSTGKPKPNKKPEEKKKVLNLSKKETMKSVDLRPQSSRDLTLSIHPKELSQSVENKRLKEMQKLIDIPLSSTLK